MRTKFVKQAANLPGLTPLGCAAMVGHAGVTKLLLDLGAELLPNDRGDMPAGPCALRFVRGAQEDSALKNGHNQLVPMLSTFFA